MKNCVLCHTKSKRKLCEGCTKIQSFVNIFSKEYIIFFLNKSLIERKSEKKENTRPSSPITRPMGSYVNQLYYPNIQGGYPTAPPSM